MSGFGVWSHRAAVARAPERNHVNIVVDSFTDPEGFHLNLRNEPFPAGAIRGQLQD